jgi:hypothetical protein
MRPILLSAGSFDAGRRQSSKPLIEHIVRMNRNDWSPEAPLPERVAHVGCRKGC